MRGFTGIDAVRLALGLVTAIVAVAAVAPSAFAGPPPPGPLSAVPNPFDFLVKPSVGTVSFKNTSGAPVQVTAVNTYSAPAVPSVDFTVQAFSSSCSTLPLLLPGMTCTVDVVVQPTAVAGQHAGLRVDSLSGPSMADISYLAAAPPAGPAFISPTSYNFGAVAVGASSPVFLFKMENPSGAPRAISPTLSAGYVLSGGTCGATLAAFAACVYGVVFSPPAYGNYMGTLDVTLDGGPTFVRANLNGVGFALQPNAGSQGGGYVLVGSPNIESNRDRFEWAIRERADGTLYGKEVTYRFTEGGVRYVARVAVSAIPFGGLYIAGGYATFDGSATLATYVGAVETPVAGTYFMHVESDDVIAGSNNGAGFDRVFIQIGSNLGPLHQTGSPGSPAVITWGAVGNGNPWVA